jgi:hypothetical protein
MNVKLTKIMGKCSQGGSISPAQYCRYRLNFSPKTYAIWQKTSGDIGAQYKGGSQYRRMCQYRRPCIRVSPAEAKTEA